MPSVSVVVAVIAGLAVVVVVDVHDDVLEQRAGVQVLDEVQEERAGTRHWDRGVWNIMETIQCGYCRHCRRGVWNIAWKQCNVVTTDIGTVGSGI